MTGDRSFLLLEFPQYQCLAPLKKFEDNLQTGNLKRYALEHLFRKPLSCGLFLEPI